MSQMKSYSKYLATVCLSSVRSFNDWISLLCEGYLCSLRILFQKALQPYLTARNRMTSWSDLSYICKGGLPKIWTVSLRTCSPLYSEKILPEKQENRKTFPFSCFLLFAVSSCLCGCHRPMIVVLLNFNFSMCLWIE